MGAHDWHDRIRETNALQNLGADQRMNLHLLEFFRREAAGLRDDVFRHGKFSDVVQQRGSVQRLKFRPNYTQFFGYFNGIDADALQVLVRRVIFGFNRQRQGLNRPKMQVRHFLDVAFLVLQLTQVQTIGAVDEINRRHEHQRCFPVESFVEPRNRAGDSRSHQVVRERPEITIHQNPRERLALGQGNDSRDRACVSNEVNRCRDAK